MKLSVIIPVYKVEDYIEKCVRSCENQDVDKGQYEILCINDGSPDRSAEIIEKLCSEYSNIRLLSQENGGLSSARNTGIDESRGDYLWFVDSDDWIEEQSLADIFPLLDGTEVISVNSYFRNFQDGSQRTVINGLNASNGRDYSTRRFNVMAQLFIFNRCFIEKSGFRFKEGIFHEDTNLIPRALYFVETIKCYSKPVYHYLLRGNSITTGFNPKKVYDLFDTFEELWAFGQNVVEERYRRKWCGVNLSGCIAEALWLTRHSSDDKLKMDVKSFVNNHKECTYSLFISPKIGCKMLACLSFLMGHNLYQAYNLLYKMRYW